MSPKNSPSVQRAATEFYNTVKAASARCLEAKWLGSGTPHRVQCSKGHIVTPVPIHIKEGINLCTICSGRNTKATEEKFLSTVKRLGASVRYTVWQGVRIRYAGVCPSGHDVLLRPCDVMAKNKIPCKRCAGLDRGQVEKEFVDRVSRLGGEVLGQFKTSTAAVSVKCGAGHLTKVSPNYVQSNFKIACRRCTKRNWNIFYIVLNPIACQIKFGVTSGNPKRRLAIHAKAGYTEVIKLLINVDAYSLETEVKKLLKAKGHKPVHGVEYFSTDCLSDILDMTASYDRVSV